MRNHDGKGGVTIVEGTRGQSLLEASWNASLECLEGACDHAMACSTCQVYIVKDCGLAPPSEEELDMLDLAYEAKDNSRLACQITMSPSIDGLVVEVPSGVANRLGEF